MLFPRAGPGGESVARGGGGPRGLLMAHMLVTMAVLAAVQADSSSTGGWGFP